MGYGLVERGQAEKRGTLHVEQTRDRSCWRKDVHGFCGELNLPNPLQFVVIQHPSGLLSRPIRDRNSGVTIENGWRRVLWHMRLMACPHCSVHYLDLAQTPVRPCNTRDKRRKRVECFKEQMYKWRFGTRQHIPQYFGTSCLFNYIVYKYM